MGKHNKAERIRKHNERLNSLEYYGNDERKAAMVYFKENPLRYVHIPGKPRKQKLFRRNRQPWYVTMKLADWIELYRRKNERS